MVREAVWSRCEERKCTLALAISVNTLLEQKVEGPLTDDSFCIEVSVACGCIPVCGGWPIVTREKVFREDARIAQRQAQAFSPRWIAGAGGIAKQHNTVAIRMIDPSLCHIEVRERTDGPCPRVHLSGIPALVHSSTKRVMSRSPCSRSRSVP